MRNAAFCITGLALQGLSMSLMAQTDKPNIVIIMTDQQRADLCGREGFPLAVTPYVDQLAQENVWFNKAYTVAPASSPARCSMFTGRFPSATHVRTNHNIPDIFFEQDLVGVLKENGYKTALVGKNHAYLKPADLDFWSEYGHWGKNKKTTPEEKEPSCPMFFAMTKQVTVLADPSMIMMETSLSFVKPQRMARGRKSAS